MEMNIAVIDDEVIVCNRLKRALENEGHQVEIFCSGQDFLQRFSSHPFHLVFTDLRLPGINGITILKHIKQTNEETEVILITGYATIDTAIEAIQSEAYHYVTKQLKLNEIRLLTNRIRENILLRVENRELREASGKKDSPENIVGTSRAMLEHF